MTGKSRKSWIAALALWANVALGAPPASDSSPELRFREVVVPADRPETWPTRKDRYVPLAEGEFRKLLETAQAKHFMAGDPSLVRLESITAAAELESSDCLAGVIELRFSRGLNQAASAYKLVPLGVAVSDAHWKDSPDRDVQLGSNAQGVQTVIVEGSGTLQMKWTLRGERTAAGAVAFRVALPAATLSTLDLQLPLTSMVSTDTGILIASEPTGDARRKWHLDLGGRKEVVLKISPAGAAQQRTGLTLLREAVRYEFSPRGVDVTAQLKLDVHHEPIQRLRVRLDAPLQLVGARFGSTDIPWVALQDRPDRESEILLELPEALLGAGRVIALKALAPLESGRKWKLPHIHIEGTYWQEGSATLVLPSPLVLEHIRTANSRQTRTAPLPAPLAGDSFDIQYFAPNADVEVVVARPSERLTLDSASSIELGPGRAIGRLTAEFTARQTETFVVAGAVSPSWEIDTVETDGASSVVDWNVERDKQGRRLIVRLAKAISMTQAARLRIAGHRPFQLDQRLDARDLRMVVFENVRTSKQLMSVRAAEAYELKASGVDGLNRLDAAHLSAREAQLMPEAPAAFLFEVDAGTGRLSVGLAPKRPSYNGTVNIDAVAQEGSLIQTFTFRCTPESGTLDKLPVYFSQASQIPLVWSLTGGTSGQLSAQRLTRKEQQQAGMPDSGEAWQVRLRLPRSGAFEVRAVSRLPLKNQQWLTLASLPEAVTQRGTLVIRALADTGLAVDAGRLKPLPAEPLQPTQYQTARNTFRFEPGRDAAQVKVEVKHVGASPVLSGAWAWNSDLRSRYDAGSAALHRLTYRIQSAGRRSVNVKLAPGSVVRGSWINGQPVTINRTAKGTMRVDLPPGRRFCSLAIEYETSESLPSFWRPLKPPLPQLDVPVLAQGWTLMLPPGYELLDADPGRERGEARELSWSERVFGPLGRSPSGIVFNPFTGEAWKQLFRGRSTTSSEARKFLSALAAIGGSAGKDRPRTWGALLKAASDRSGVRVFIDLSAVDQLGYTWNSRVPAADADKVFTLTRAGLACLISDNSIVVTSLERACQNRSQLLALEQPNFFIVRSGDLLDSIQKATAGSQVTRFVPLNAWKAGASRPESPWHPFANMENQWRPEQGWSLISLDIAPGEMITVRAVRSAAARSIGWALFLIVVGVGVWRGSRRLAVRIGLVLLLASLSLMLPSAYSLITAPVVLGLLFTCIVVTTTRSADDDRERVRTPESSMRLPVPAALLMAAVAAFDIAQACRSTAAEPLREPTAQGDKQQSAGPQAYKKVSARNVAEATVLVPVDLARPEKERTFYLPEAFYERIMHRAAQYDSKPRGWLLRHANYHGNLSRQQNDGRARLAELECTFDFEVLDGTTRAVLPLGNKTHRVRGVEVDGTPAPWDYRDQRLSVELNGTRQTQVTVVLEPNATGGSPGDFELTIPKASDAELNLSGPPELASIESASIGRVEFDKDRSRLRAALGPIDKLQMQWSESFLEENAGLPELDELLWFRVHPGSVALEAKYKLKRIPPGIRRITLYADSQLRLLPTANSSTTASRVQVLPGNPQTILVDLPSAPKLVEPYVLDLTFILAGTSGIGNLRLPSLAAADLRPVNRWLALSVDPTLQYEEQVGLELKRMSVTSFATAWGVSNTQPDAAYSTAQPSPAWTLSTRPLEPKTSAQQRLALGVSREQIEVSFEAQLETQAGYNLTLELSGPKDLEIETISIIENQAERVARWSKDDEGLITIFLTAPVTGEQSLWLRGRLPTPSGDRIAAPALRIVGSETQRLQLAVFRSSAIIVEVAAQAGVAAAELSVRPRERELGSPVGLFRLNKPDVRPILSISPNLPSVDAIQLISLERENDAWYAASDYHISTHGGLVDILRFDIPSQWAEPFQANQPGTLEVLNIPGENRRQLVFRPLLSIAKTYSLKLRGRVTLSGAERLQVPDIVPRGFKTLQRYVILPLQLELQQVLWDHYGLEIAKLPSSLHVKPVSPESFATYRVVTDNFRASLKSLEHPTGVPQIRQMDTALAWATPGHAYGVTIFDIDPAGSTSCTLECPPQVDLVYLAVSGLPAEPASKDNRLWRIRLGSPELPQRIGALFRAKLNTQAVTSGRVEVLTPRLQQLHVEQSLWTVFAPAWAGEGNPLRAEVITPLRAASLRADNVRGLLELSSGATGQQLPDDVMRWNRPWQRRDAAARAELSWESIVNASRNIESDQPPGGPAPDAAAAGTDWREDMSVDLVRYDSQTQPVLIATGSDPRPPSISYADNLASSRWRWTAWAWCLGLAGVVLIYGGRRREFGYMAPAHIALVVGLCWWLWLAPSFIGLMILFIALAAEASIVANGARPSAG